jgi:hypothetical protein
MATKRAWRPRPAWVAVAGVHVEEFAEELTDVAISVGVGDRVRLRASANNRPAFDL